MLLHYLPGDIKKEGEMDLTVGLRNTIDFYSRDETTIKKSKHKIKTTKVPLKTNGEKAIKLKYQVFEILLNR